MTQYSYQELREALTKAADDLGSININGAEDIIWSRTEMDQLQTILDYLPDKTTAEQEGDKVRADAWVAVLKHPFFNKERWGNGSILEAVLEKLDELHRGPLPTEYGSVIKNVKVVLPDSGTREYDYMQLCNVGWVGVGKAGVLRDEQPEHITSWEPLDSE